METIVFKPRWREELEAISKEGKLIFELTMGRLHVYFPDEKCWNNSVPAWAKDKLKDYFDGCQKWCAANRIPMTVVERALVYEEKNIG
jgi:hypothetical protein